VLGSLVRVKPRRSQPSTPVRNGLAAAFIAFTPPVAFGVAEGGIDGRQFAFVTLLAAAAFLVVFTVSRLSQRRHQT
jgi:hypothetical protein